MFKFEPPLPHFNVEWRYVSRFAVTPPNIVWWGGGEDAVLRKGSNYNLKILKKSSLKNHRNYANYYCQIYASVPTHFFNDCLNLDLKKSYKFYKTDHNFCSDAWIIMKFSQISNNWICIHLTVSRDFRSQP